MTRLVTKEQAIAWSNGEITIVELAKEMGRQEAAVAAMVEMLLGTEKYAESIKINRLRVLGSDPILMDEEDLKAWFMHETGFTNLKAKYNCGAERVSRSLKLTAEKFWRELELLRNPPAPAPVVIPNKVEFKKRSPRVDLISDMDFDRLNNKTITPSDLARELGCNYHTLLQQYHKKLEKVMEANKIKTRADQIVAARGGV